VVSTAFTDPGTASGFLGTYGILGLILMYLLANLALIVEWAKFRRNGIRKNPWLWVVTPVIGIIVLAIPVYGDLRPGQPSPYNTLPWLTLALIAVGIAYAVFLGVTRPAALASAPALLEGDESLATDPLPVGPAGADGRLDGGSFAGTGPAEGPPTSMGARAAGLAARAPGVTGPRRRGRSRAAWRACPA
jgi:hypothetical protein